MNTSFDLKTEVCKACGAKFTKREAEDREICKACQRKAIERGAS
jgi:predicted amidophosphoribosyltransferase